MTLLGIGAVLALIVANGYFVAAEFAYVAANRHAIETAAEAGDRRAGRAVRVLQQLSFMLSGAQLGITVTSLVVGFIAAPVFRDAFEPLLTAVGVGDAAGTIAVAAGFVVATMGQMLVGELAPKNLAIARAEPICRRLAPSLRVFLVIAGPLIRLFDGASNRLLRTIGIEPVEELHGTVSVEELDLIVEESSAEGALEPARARLLERALAFPDITALEAATPRPRVVSVDADATCADLRAAMVSGHSRFPVMRDNELAGVVHVKALLGVPRRAWASTPVAWLMSAPVVVPETAHLPVVLNRLHDGATELATVIDEHGSFVGVVTAEDLAEELVGDIVDEVDQHDADLRLVAPQRYAVAGTFRIDEIERELGVLLPEGEYDTIAGLVLAELGRLAVPGDEVVVDGHSIRVTAVDRRAIRTVSLHLTRPVEPGDHRGGDQ